MTTPTFPSTALRRALVGLGVVAVLSVGALALTAGPTIEILADGTVHDVPAAEGSVADALDAAGVDLDSDDLVSPDLSADAEPGTRIVVTPGWHDPVTDGQVITIDTPVEVTLDVDGRERRVVTLAAEVDDLLRLHQVEVGPDDVVEPSPATPLDAQDTITVQRVDHREESVEVVLEREEVRREDATLERGRTVVEEEGRDGLRHDTYAVTLVDGAETERELLEREVVTEPVDRVVRVGTRSPLPPAPSGVPASDDPVWTRLAQCESTGDWQAVSANGLYYGGLQFHPQTWRMVGGTGMPHEASRQEQIRRAQILLSQPWATWGNQWPACSRQLGLA
ncbi:MAG: transglycosylase family protein [Nitriliruptoraceae bacterium]